MLEKDLLFDKRIIQRNFIRKTVTKEQYDEHMKKLPDMQTRMETQEICVREGEFPIEFVEPEE